MNSPYLHAIRTILLLGIMLMLAACAAGNPAGSAPDNDSEVEPAATAAPATTAPATTLAELPTLVPSPTPIPFATPTNTPTTPATAGLEGFMAELESALRNHDAAGLAASMSDPFALGAWRSEWRTLTPQEAAGEILEYHTLAGLFPKDPNSFAHRARILLS